MKSSFSDCWVGWDVGSDHLPLHLGLNMLGADPVLDRPRVRCWNKADWSLYKVLINDFLRQNSLPLDGTIEGVDQSVEMFSKMVLVAIDEACPLRDCSVWRFSLPPDILAMIREKRKVRRKMQSNIACKREYNLLNKRVADAIVKYKRVSWHRATATLNYRKGKNFWDQFKRLIKSGKASGSRCTSLKDTSGMLVKDPTKVADLFAQHLEASHKVNVGPE